MRLDDIQIIVRKRDYYLGLVKKLELAQALSTENTRLEIGSTRVFLTLAQAEAVRNTLVSQITKDLELAKTELMMLGVTEFT